MYQIPFYKEENAIRYREYQARHEEFTMEEVITYVNIGLDCHYYSNVQKIAIPDSTSVLVNKYYQLDENYLPMDLEVIDCCFNCGGLLLRHGARVAFEGMCKEAKMEGLLLSAISTFRSFSYQDAVYYKNYIQGTELDTYRELRDRVSARAGHSEHQTGLAVDINDLETSFETTPEGMWLKDNSWKYGYILRYPKGKEWITGYDYEPWHFRYLGISLAKLVCESELTYDEYYTRFLA